MQNTDFFDISFTFFRLVSIVLGKEHSLSHSFTMGEERAGRYGVLPCQNFMSELAVPKGRTRIARRFPRFVERGKHPMLYNLEFGREFGELVEGAFL